MKTLLLGIAAAATLAIAAPAFAHPDDEEYGVDTYANFNQEYQHIWQGIQHGLSDRSYTSYQAQRYWRELQDIRARAYWEERRGYYDPEDIQARIEQLHTRMHVAHERGHERLNNDWNYNGGYDRGGYNGGYDRNYNGGYDRGYGNYYGNSPYGRR